MESTWRVALFCRTLTDPVWSRVEKPISLPRGGVGQPRKPRLQSHEPLQLCKTSGDFTGKPVEWVCIVTFFPPKIRLSTKEKVDALASSICCVMYQKFEQAGFLERKNKTKKHHPEKLFTQNLFIV